MAPRSRPPKPPPCSTVHRSAARLQWATTLLVSSTCLALKMLRYVEGEVGSGIHSTEIPVCPMDRPPMGNAWVVCIRFGRSISCGQQ